ncbi:MAG: peroxiredoxin family protein [Nitrososphaerales archaeon]
MENADGKLLPEANLIDIHGGKFDDKLLRQGRCILVFVTPDCNACLTESEFLKTIIDKQKKLPFYGIVSFGGRQATLDAAKRKFPFDVFYDEGFKLAGALGIRRVPIKIFVEDGVIIKTWGGATTRKEKQEDFINWLKEL